MADLDLEFVERHVLRQLISAGHDQCVPRNEEEKYVLDSLTKKGLMEFSGNRYRLTKVGKAVKLKDLRW